MQQISTTADELRDQLRAAEQRQRQLEYEHKNIDAEITEAARTAAREKAQAARNGEGFAVPADLDVEHLRRRREELPFEVWSARITTTQLTRDARRAELEEASAESRKAAEDFAQAQDAARKAEEVRDRAYARHSGSGARLQRLNREIKDATRTLQSLEESPPRV